MSEEVEGRGKIRSVVFENKFVNYCQFRIFVNHRNLQILQGLRI